MTVNSLSNFGVPGQDGSRGPVLQPVMSNKFRVVFYDFGNNGEVAPYDLTRQIRRIGRPTVRFETQSLYSYVSTVYIATRAEWQELNVKFFDDITGRVLSRVQQQVSKQQNFFDQTTSRAGENYKFEMDIDVLAGGASAGGGNDPNILQKWSLAGCMLTNFNPGEMTYQTPDGMELEVTIRYDNCITFNQNGTQLGTFSHATEIAARAGTLSTGIGIGGGFGLNIGGLSVSVGGGLNLNLGGGGATVSGSANLGVAF